jgi:hypothetical protein
MPTITNDLDFRGSFSGDFEEVFAFDLGLPGDVLGLIFAVPGVLLEFGREPLARGAEDEDRSSSDRFFFIFFLSLSR